MSTAPAGRHLLPYRLLKNLDGTDTGIDIAEWSIHIRKGPIANSLELDQASEQLGFKLPVMFFSHNMLQVRHAPSQLSLAFVAIDALKKVDVSDTSADSVKVAHAEHWTRRSAAAMKDVNGFVKPYDWTYTTDYAGTLQPGHDNQTWQETDLEVDIQRLKLPEPILFYHEAVLYEDELDDNGTAVLNLRVRVMPSCFLILLRFFLRVDNVLFRINDTRIYHEFGHDSLIREFSCREAPYEEVRSKLPKSAPWESNKVVQDLSNLADANWVASVLETAKSSRRERVRVGDGYGNGGIEGQGIIRGDCLDGDSI
ncbi:hypothetical protein SeLEV6574_g07395 [Synchytrium endobioticum]|uniref:TIP41-like protein n=1 Tax=Synchytrium endobioticum TaxID=286115 RepID=A0A507CCC6_9FUNG|nr:hypothetical protein SeLEV6574_g07395 [Synchytrium endobioticum]